MHVVSLRDVRDEAVIPFLLPEVIESMRFPGRKEETVPLFLGQEMFVTRYEPFVFYSAVFCGFLLIQRIMDLVYEWTNGSYSKRSTSNLPS